MPTPWSKPGNHRPRRHYNRWNRFHQSSRWKRLSETFRKQPENAICADCQQVPAEEVHHKISVQRAPHLAYDVNNLLALCRRCHGLRTKRGE